MEPSGTGALFLGAVLLGLLHGAEPGHGWPIAAAYALDRSNRWARGVAASALLGIGHLFSSIVVVAIFLLVASSVDLSALQTPLRVLGVQIGSPLGVVAGGLLVLLGIREYRHGHGHDHGGGHGHDHQDPGRSHEHGHDHDHAHPHEHGGDSDEDRGRWWEPVARLLPARPARSRDHPAVEDVDTAGLSAIVWAAFVLGFAHEEEFEIIGLCVGSEYCLELMLAYATAVIAALVGLTMLLVAGYTRYEERVEGVAAYFPGLSAAVLVLMGIGFIGGVV